MVAMVIGKLEILSFWYILQFGSYVGQVEAALSQVTVIEIVLVI